MKSIMVWNRKGGVGKTTLALHLAWYFAEQGRKVLFLDVDTQRNASSALRDCPVLGSTIELFKPGTVLAPTSESDTGIQVFEATEELDHLERSQWGQVAQAFRTHLRELSGRFDVCLIDAPPDSSVKTLACLASVDFGITPVNLESFGMEGVVTMLKTFGAVRQKFNPKMQFLGMVPWMVDNRRTGHREALELLFEHYPSMMLPLKVSVRSKVAEAVSERLPVWKLKDAKLATEEMFALMTKVSQKVFPDGE